MRVKFLHAYQAIRFENSLNTYFVDERYRTESHGQKVARVRIETTEYGLLVYNDKCAVLVGWANVGSAEIDRESLDISALESKGKSEQKSAKSTKTASA